MNSKDVIGNDGGNRKEIEEVGEQFPDSCAPIFILTFHIESVILSNCSELVISSD